MKHMKTHAFMSFMSAYFTRLKILDHAMPLKTWEAGWFSSNE